MSICILKNNSDHYEITTDSVCSYEGFNYGSSIGLKEGIKNPKVLELCKDFYVIHAGSPMFADLCVDFCLNKIPIDDLKCIDRLKMSCLLVDFKICMGEKFKGVKPYEWVLRSELAFVSPFYMRVNLNTCTCSDVNEFEILGAGRQIGYGAMKMGATPTKAVEIACQYVNCSLPVFTTIVKKEE